MEGSLNKNKLAARWSKLSTYTRTRKRSDTPEDDLQPLLVVRIVAYKDIVKRTLIFILVTRSTFYTVDLLHLGVPYIYKRICSIKRES